MPFQTWGQSTRTYVSAVGPTVEAQQVEVLPVDYRYWYSDSTGTHEQAPHRETGSSSVYRAYGESVGFSQNIAKSRVLVRLLYL
jgi:hypothetical protein